MKWLILFLFVIGLNAQTILDGDRSSYWGSESTSNYLLSENFNGTGYENTWTEDIATDGTVDEDYATSPAPLEGTHSLYLSEGTGGDVYSYHDFGTAYSEIYAYFMFVVATDWPNTTTRWGASFRSSTGTSLGAATFNISGTAVTFTARIGATSGTATVASFNEGDTVHVWLEYSNTNDSCNVYFSADGVKPAAGGNYHSGVSAGISTDAQRFYLTSDYPSEALMYDKIRVDTVAIGSNPQ